MYLHTELTRAFQNNDYWTTRASPFIETLLEVSFTVLSPMIRSISELLIITCLRGSPLLGLVSMVMFSEPWVSSTVIVAKSVLIILTSGAPDEDGSSLSSF